MQNSNTSGRGLATSKLFPLRGARAETRNRAKDELRRVINAVERVRKWEKRWVVLKDSAISVYKWVPVSGQAITPPKPVNTAASSVLPPNTSESNLAETAAEEDTNASAVSPENSNGETNNAPRSANFIETNGEENDDSSAAFFNTREAMGMGEAFADSDSNQTSSFDRINYGHHAAPDGHPTRTDFSALMEEEEAQRIKTAGESGIDAEEKDDSDSDTPTKRRRME